MADKKPTLRKVSAFLYIVTSKLNRVLILFYVVVNNSYNEDVECHRKCRRNVIENVIEILRKIK